MNLNEPTDIDNLLFFRCISPNVWFTLNISQVIIEQYHTCTSNDEWFNCQDKLEKKTHINSQLSKPVLSNI